MIKGVNHQVVEVTKPTCEYFEKVLFFVKPEFASVSQGKLRDRAHLIANNTGRPPQTRMKRKKTRAMLVPVFWSMVGAGLCALVMKVFGL